MIANSRTLIIWPSIQVANLNFELCNSTYKFIVLHSRQRILLTCWGLPPAVILATAHTASL